MGTETYHEMRDTLDQTATLLTHAETVAQRAIEKIAVGRLRFLNLSHHVLAELKRELRQYDITKGRWKR